MFFFLNQNSTTTTDSDEYDDDEKKDDRPITTTTEDNDYDENDDDDITESYWATTPKLTKEFENRIKQKCLEYKSKLDELNQSIRQKYDSKLFDEHDIESLAENIKMECCTLRKVYIHLNFNCASG